MYVTKATGSFVIAVPGWIRDFYLMPKVRGGRGEAHTGWGAVEVKGSADESHGHIQEGAPHGHRALPAPSGPTLLFIRGSTQAGLYHHPVRCLPAAQSES